MVARIYSMSQGKVIANSGMTVATGFDLGQWRMSVLQDLGSSKQLLDKLRPYLGHPFRGFTKTQVIEKVGKLGPVPQLTKAEADTCDAAVFSKILGDVVSVWNAPPRYPGVPQFTALPSGWQTVLLSRNYQEGPRPQNIDAVEFRHAAVSGKWLDAIAKLRSYRDYSLRAMQEAAFLAKELPTPIASTQVPGR